MLAAIAEGRIGGPEVGPEADIMPLVYLLFDIQAEAIVSRLGLLKGLLDRARRHRCTCQLLLLYEAILVVVDAVEEVAAA